MLPIQTILHPTDFSTRSENAFQLARTLARDHGADLHILHVIPIPIVVFGDGIVPVQAENYPQQQRQKLLRLKAGDAKVRVEHHLAEGDAPEEILRLAKDISCDLIVMGTHGWTGLSRLLMGSVAEKVVRKAPCPVLTVKTPFPPARPAAEEAEKVLETANV